MPKAGADIDLDGVLNEIGQFGRFQIKQYGLMVIPVIFHAMALSYVFTAGRLNYRCEIPGCEDVQHPTYLPAWISNSVPFINGAPSRCERYELSSNPAQDKLSCDAADFDADAVIRCDSFIYEDDEVTIAREFNITCPNNDWKLALVGTVNNIGQFVALPVAGYLSDRYGRKLVLVMSVAGSAVFGILRAYATSYEMFLVMEFLDPAMGTTMYSTAFLLGLELVAAEMRVTGNNIISCLYALGEAILGLLAMHFRNWRTLLKVAYIPGLLSVPLLLTTSESIRWLISKGHREKAFKLLQKAAAMNGKQLSPSAIDKYCPKPDDDLEHLESQNSSFYKLLRNAIRSPGLLLRVVNCSFCWLTNTLVYYGLSLNSVTLAGDKYLNFILVALIELPGYVILQMILDRIGRRITLCSSMLLCGLFCFLSEFVPAENHWTNLGMFLVSKLAITMSFCTLYIYTAEIFPTNLRQSLMAICSMFGRFGSMIAPQTPLLAKLWLPLPMVVFGTMGIASGLTILQFPETLNTQLPNTVEEAMSMNSDGDKDYRKVRTK
ncbi:organic cation transporter [Culex quinquefasciatus]|uniref:Organic cation transporter n=1 Tax=Culex quinquefasciatus TaxID=7176 RepID=B0XDE9_CULQU|nr:organic cation transporter [Culex quinquefasciatus]|eukprot:XP_001867671.1 organic cation transporter [Culex quinquefasciatus]